jgi:hypothetical protein
MDNGPVGKLRYEQLNDERVIADSFGLQSLLNEGFSPTTCVRADAGRALG